MFITQAKEIMEACPTARIDAKDAQRLVRSVEEEEQSLLEPLLGDELIELLAGQYRQYVEKFGGITTDKLDLQRLDDNDNDDDDVDSALSVPVLRKTVPLLRDIQSALVYRMFSNKIYTISTSLNLGGGANRASAGDYDPADDKHLQELKKEFWMNSIHACDNILVKLEKDAKQEAVTGTTGTAEPLPENPDEQGGQESPENKSLWYALWKDSDGYFMKEDTLFPTMRDLKKFYPCDQPTRFLAVQPLLMYCQNTYITPRVNEVAPDLMDVLLDPTHPLTAEEKKAKKLLRIALSYHMQAHQAPKSSGKNATPFNSAPGVYSITPDKNEMIQSADSALSTALAYIEKHCVAVDPGESGESGEPGNSGESGNSGSACNWAQGHENHVDDPNLHRVTGDNGCCCKPGRKDEEYTTFSTLMPGLNRW